MHQPPDERQVHLPAMASAPPASAPPGPAPRRTRSGQWDMTITGSSVGQRRSSVSRVGRLRAARTHSPRARRSRTPRPARGIAHAAVLQHLDAGRLRAPARPPRHHTTSHDCPAPTRRPAAPCSLPNAASPSAIAPRSSALRFDSRLHARRQNRRAARRCPAARHSCAAMIDFSRATPMCGPSRVRVGDHADAQRRARSSRGSSPRRGGSPASPAPRGTRGCRAPRRRVTTAISAPQPIQPGPAPRLQPAPQRRSQAAPATATAPAQASQTHDVAPCAAATRCYCDSEHGRGDDAEPRLVPGRARLGAGQLHASRACHRCAPISVCARPSPARQRRSNPRPPAPALRQRIVGAAAGP